jgi:hypothetical protein
LLSQHNCWSILLPRSLFRKCISHVFSTASFSLDRELRNGPRAQTLSASKSLLPSFTLSRQHVDRIIDIPSLLPRCHETFFVGRLNIGVCVDSVVGRDSWCC